MTVAQGPKQLLLCLSPLHLTLTPQAQGSRIRGRTLEPGVLITKTLLSQVHKFPKSSWQIQIQPGLWLQVKCPEVIVRWLSLPLETKDNRNCLQATENFIFFSMWCYSSLWPPPERSRTRCGSLIRLRAPHPINYARNLMSAMLLSEKKEESEVRGLRLKPQLPPLTSCEIWARLKNNL